MVFAKQCPVRTAIFIVGSLPEFADFIGDVIRGGMTDVVLFETARIDQQ